MYSTDRTQTQRRLWPRMGRGSWSGPAGIVAMEWRLNMLGGSWIVGHEVSGRTRGPGAMRTSASTWVVDTVATC